MLLSPKAMKGELTIKGEVLVACYVTRQESKLILTCSFCSLQSEIPSFDKSDVAEI